MGKETQKRGDIRIHIADSLYYTGEINTIATNKLKQLYSKKKKKTLNVYNLKVPLLVLSFPSKYGSSYSRLKHVGSCLTATFKTYCAPTVCVKSLQQGPTPCNPMDCSPRGSPVPGSLQARTLEWVATPSSRGSSQPRDRTHVSYVGSLPLVPGKPEYLLHSTLPWQLRW